MLPSKERLNRREFNETLKNRVSVIFNNIGTLKYIIGEKKALSVVTSSKHEKKAVLRNKLRRRIYNLFKNYGQNLTGIMYTSSKSYGMPYEELKKLVHELFDKISKNNK